MAEQTQEGTQTATEQQQSQPDESGKAPDFEGGFDEDKAKRLISNLRDSEDKLKAKVAELSEKAKKADELEESKKTDLEKATGRAEKAEAKAAEIEAELTRLQVATEKGVPAELVEFLNGADRKELEAKADKLLEYANGKGESLPGPRPDLSQGSSGNGDKPLNGDPLLRDLTQKLGIR